MTEKPNLKSDQLCEHIATKMGCEKKQAQNFMNAFMEVFYETIEEDRGLTITNLGTFYLNRRTESVAFRFNPSQKLRAALGWSSSYKGSL